MKKLLLIVISVFLLIWLAVFFKHKILLNAALPNTVTAFSGKDNVLNIYNWSDYLPEDVLKNFEAETGIHVNYSTYDNNETMYAKLKANPDIGYDIVVPSTYFIERMRREHMLLPLDQTRLTNFKNLNPALLDQTFDPHNQYSIPYLASATGIIYNDQYYPVDSIKNWTDLWAKKYHNQLLILDDVREVFSIALLALGDSPNTQDAKKIQAAFFKLKNLLPNIKLFNDEAVKAIYIDEDATVGMIWSGDAFQAELENPHLHFIYPNDGYLISEDSLVIPVNAPHVNNAYLFINYILRPKVAARIAEETGFTTPNLAAKQYLPKVVRDSAIMYPDEKTLLRGQFQLDAGNATDLYEHYLELLKLSR